MFREVLCQVIAKGFAEYGILLHIQRGIPICFLLVIGKTVIGILDTILKVLLFRDLIFELLDLIRGLLQVRSDFFLVFPSHFILFPGMRYLLSSADDWQPKHCREDASDLPNSSQQTYSYHCRKDNEVQYPSQMSDISQPVFPRY